MSRVPHPGRKSDWPQCSVEGCENGSVVLSRELCETHYRRWRNYGDPTHYPSSEDRYNWRGDDITYRAMHLRLRRMRGNPDQFQCVTCGEIAAEWAYDGSCPREKRQLHGYYVLRYSPDIDRYEPKCTRCHRRADNKGALVSAFGEMKTLREWSMDPRCAMNVDGINRRVTRLGWDYEKAIAKPPRKISPRGEGYRSRINPSPRKS